MGVYSYCVLVFVLQASTIVVSLPHIDQTLPVHIWFPHEKYSPVWCSLPKHCIWLSFLMFECNWFFSVHNGINRHLNCQKYSVYVWLKGDNVCILLMTPNITMSIRARLHFVHLCIYLYAQVFVYKCRKKNHNFRCCDSDVVYIEYCWLSIQLHLRSTSPTSIWAHLWGIFLIGSIEVRRPPPSQPRLYFLVAAYIKKQGGRKYFGVWLFTLTLTNSSILLLSHSLIYIRICFFGIPI